MKYSIFIFFILSVGCYAQELKIDKIDEFTGKKYKESKSINLTGITRVDNNWIDLYLKQIDSIYYAQIYVRLKGSTFTIDTSNILSLRLSNGNVINLIPTRKVTAEIFSEAGNLKNAHIEYIIKRSQLQELSQSQPLKFRFNFPGDFFDADINKTAGKNLMKAAIAILK